MAYSDKLVDHYENPRNVGAMDKNSEKVGTGLVGAPACGDVMKLQIKVEDNIIEDAKFKTFGCGSAIASSSLVTEWIKGKTINEASNNQLIGFRVKGKEKKSLEIAIQASLNELIPTRIIIIVEEGSNIDILQIIFPKFFFD